jgi:hypothetical protein
MRKRIWRILDALVVLLALVGFCVLDEQQAARIMILLALVAFFKEALKEEEK